MAVLRLKGKGKDTHLDNLIRCLEIASHIGLDDYGQVEEILNMLHFIRGDDKFSHYDEVKIESNFSGFPTFNAVNELLLDRKYAHDFLEKLPPLQRCVERCMKQLHTKNGSPKFSRIQDDVRKIKFYSQLQKKQLPQTDSHRTELFEQFDDFNSYTIIFKGYDIAKMRFLSYSLQLFQRGNSAFLKNGQLSPLLEQMVRKEIGQSTAEMFYNLNQQDKIAVISVERLVFGPFYTPYTENRDQKMDEVVLTTDSSDSGTYVMEIEQQTCEDTETYLTQDIFGAMSRLHKREMRPKIVYKRHFICSNEQVFNAMEKRYITQEFHSKFYRLSAEHAKGGEEQVTEEQVSEEHLEEEEK